MSITNEIKKALTTEEINQIVSLATAGFMELQCSSKPDHSKLRKGFSDILRVCEIPYEYTEAEKQRYGWPTYDDIRRTRP